MNVIMLWIIGVILFLIIFGIIMWVLEWLMIDDRKCKMNPLEGKDINDMRDGVHKEQIKEFIKELENEK